MVRWAGVALATVLVVGASPVFADEQVRLDYLLHCSGCHLPDGRGAPPVVPGLQGDLGVIVGLPEGREYLVRVPGASQTPITDKQLTDITNWILYRFNEKTLPTDFQPLTVAEVSRARSRVLLDPLRKRAEIWDRIEHRDTSSYSQ
ncbi:MAG: hypothetical protein GKR90_11340 [Pseudomonadales bacterium]|nr:hypothetical protein [Pseudomonadales bacterium]